MSASSFECNNNNNNNNNTTVATEELDSKTLASIVNNTLNNCLSDVESYWEEIQKLDLPTNEVNRLREQVESLKVLIRTEFRASLQKGLLLPEDQVDNTVPDQVN